MDTLRGSFGSSDFSDDAADYDLTDEENSGDLPPASIGSDERRMQVRAYNHWAGLLGERNYPSIEELDPAELPDFSPYSVLLDFSPGIEDPAVQYLGEMLAAECGTDGQISKLSDVPPRSLLSRITDHYLQILANQAPIGFEAEFVNQRGLTILYRGILLPFSSDDDTIDFIYGVINWKEMANAVTADELLLEIDQALDADEELPEDEPVAHAIDPVTDWADGPGAEDEASEAPAVPDQDSSNTEVSDDIAPFELSEEDAIDADGDLPEPAFGDFSFDDYGDEEEGEEEANYDFASLTDHIRVPDKKSEAIDLEGVEPFVAPETDEPELGDDRESQDEPDQLQPRPHEDEAIDEDAAQTSVDVEFGDTPSTDDVDLQDSVAETPAPETGKTADSDYADVPAQPDDLAEDLSVDAGLYDCLASARALAETARSCEDRSRSALYAAVGRAYDFSLAAKDEPQEFDELVAESGLSVQDRAPMTPVVKLVFGADYDKTRLTEYAAVLSHAHRVGIERGELAGFLADAEGGLKGVVTAERRLRKEDAGKPVEPNNEPRAALAKKLRQLDHFGVEDLSTEGREFAVVMIRRTEDGQIAVLGEIDDDIPLIERVGRKLVG